jgi:ribose/xylose/arabinose/galactoside ABC-type transport system permease subunit
MRTSSRSNLARAVPSWLLVAFFVVMALALSPTFRTSANFSNLLRQLGPLALAALAESLVFIVGGIDLSIGATIGLTTVILSFGGGGLPPIVLAVIALAAGAAIGALNGAGVTLFRIPPLLMTFGSTAVVKGLGLLLRSDPGGTVDSLLPGLLNIELGPVSVSAIVVFLFYLAMWAFLSFHASGRKLYAVGDHGGNARKAGINVLKTTFGAYVAAGVFSALAGVLLAARIYSGDALIGGTYVVDAITAAVIGGTSLLGGVGSVLGSLAGAAILVLSNNLLNLFHIGAYFQYVVKGLILFAALLISFVGESRKRHGK